MKIPSVFLACLMAVSSLPAYVFAADTPARKPGTLVGAAKRPISGYHAPRRAFERKFSVIEEKLIAFDAKPRPATKADREKAMKELTELGGKLFREGRWLAHMLGKMFDLNSTRWGLAEEAQLVTRLRESIERSAKILQGHSGVKIAALPDEDEDEGEAKGRKRRHFILKAADKMIHKKVKAYLTEQGLEELLQPEGVKEAGDIVIGQVRLSLKAVLDAQSREVLKIPLKDLRSLNAAFRLKVRQVIRKKTAKLVMNFTGNGLVISLVQRVVLKWLKTKVWPMLREAFRQKGDLKNRVAVSIGTMKKSRDELSVLGGIDPSNISYSRIRPVFLRARGRFAATHYLDKDLKRAKRQDLIDKMDVARKDLAQVIKRVRFQFMLDNEDRRDTMIDEGDVIIGLIVTVKAILDRMTHKGDLGVSLQRPWSFTMSRVMLDPRLVYKRGPLVGKPYEHDSVARIEIGKQVRYSHFVARKSPKGRPPEYKAQFCGLVNGKHTVTGTLATADGLLEDFTFEIEVKAPERFRILPSRNLKTLKERRAKWAGANEAEKKRLASYYCRAIVQYAQSLLDYGAAKPAGIYSLLNECKAPANVMHADKSRTAPRKRITYLKARATLLFFLGDKRAYVDAKDCAAQIDSIVDAHESSDGAAAQIYFTAGRLALGSGNKAAEGKEYERKSLTITWRSKGGVPADAGWRDASLWYFPKPIAVPASMVYYGEFETDTSSSAKPDGSTSRPAGLAPR
ncbi:MAG: hypothetical protein QGG42_05030 [Phycisphaerae bacterium]|nr:hypothetical protein [Phycisphaerae bacterium]